MNKKFQELLAKYQRNQIIIDELPEDEARRLNLRQTKSVAGNPYTDFSIGASAKEEYTTGQFIAPPADFLQDWIGEDGYASREVYEMNMRSIKEGIEDQVMDKSKPESWIPEGWETCGPVLKKSPSGYACCQHCGSTNIMIDGPCRDCGKPPFIRRKT